jgi:hypothetical protein
MPIVAYLWGAGGGGGGDDSGLGGNGSGGQGYKVTFNADPGDIIDIALGTGGRAGQSGRSSAAGGAAGSGYVTDTSNRYGGGRGGNAGPSGSSGGGGGGGGATTLTLIKGSSDPVNRFASQTSGNIYDADLNDRLVAWVEGLSLTSALITEQERTTIKNNVNYSSLATYLTTLQLDTVRTAFNQVLDASMDTINSAINSVALSSVYIANSGEYAYGTGVSFSYNGTTYNRGTLAGTGTYAISVSTTERLAFILSFQQSLDTLYTNAPTFLKSVLDDLILVLVDDIIIDQFNSVSSNVSLYNYTSETPRTISVIAVAGGGGGGGGGGNTGTTTGDSAGNTPVVVGTNTTGQNGTNKSGDGGGGGGGGGGQYGGNGGGVRGGDEGGYAGSPGANWRDPNKTISGTSFLASSRTPPTMDRYSVTGTHAGGGLRTQAGTNGYAIAVVNKYSLPFVKDNDEWKPVHQAYVKIGGYWKDITAIYTKQNGRWKLLRQNDTTIPTLLSSGVNYGAGGTRS